MKQIITLIAILSFGVAYGQTETSINGTYSFNDASAIVEFSIYGNRWSSTLTIKTGLGAAYDNQNKEYNSGPVSGNDLYESSGMIIIGKVNGNRLTTLVGGRQVTLTKQ